MKATETTLAPDGLAGSEPSVRQVCEWIKTEICAGMVLTPRTVPDQVWNDAHKRAMGIVSAYAKGEGLFQITQDDRVQERRKQDADLKPNRE